MCAHFLLFYSHYLSFSYSLTLTFFPLLFPKHICFVSVSEIFFFFLKCRQRRCLNLTLLLVSSLFLFLLVWVIDPSPWSFTAGHQGRLPCEAGGVHKGNDENAFIRPKHSTDWCSLISSVAYSVDEFKSGKSSTSLPHLSNRASRS